MEKKFDLKGEIMACLPSEYIKDSITAGRIANNILELIKPYEAEIAELKRQLSEQSPKPLSDEEIESIYPTGNFNIVLNESNELRQEGFKACQERNK